RVSSRMVYSGKTVKLRVDEILDRRVKIREVVEHPGASAILPIKSNSKILLIKQYRHPVGKWILEIPAGTLKTGETDYECAVRELEEETGYKAGRLEKIITIMPSPGYSTERISIYLAFNLEKSIQNLDEDEEIELLEMDLDEAIREVMSTDEADGKTLLALLLYKYYYREKLDSRKCV
ncbi:MAG: NUDIX hydrolase, partial [Nitrososphaerota archaeon]